MKQKIAADIKSKLLSNIKKEKILTNKKYIRISNCLSYDPKKIGKGDFENLTAENYIKIHKFSSIASVSKLKKTEPSEKDNENSMYNLADSNYKSSKKISKVRSHQPKIILSNKYCLREKKFLDNKYFTPHSYSCGNIRNPKIENKKNQRSIKLFNPMKMNLKSERDERIKAVTSKSVRNLRIGHFYH